MKKKDVQCATLVNLLRVESTCYHRRKSHFPTEKYSPSIENRIAFYFFFIWLIAESSSIFYRFVLVVIFFSPRFSCKNLDSLIDAHSDACIMLMWTFRLHFNAMFVWHFVFLCTASIGSDNMALSTELPTKWLGK